MNANVNVWQCLVYSVKRYPYTTYAHHRLYMTKQTKILCQTKWYHIAKAAL